METLSAALGLGRDDEGEFDETYYEEDGYEASLEEELDESSDEDGTFDHDSEADDSDDSDEHEADDGHDGDDRA
jgi:23S rRNA pseudouridine1911/1915/1917 synthase